VGTDAAGEESVIRGLHGPTNLADEYSMHAQNDQQSPTQAPRPPAVVALRYPVGEMRLERLSPERTAEGCN